jgi:hypothetical protein
MPCGNQRRTLGDKLQVLALINPVLLLLIETMADNALFLANQR